MGSEQLLVDALSALRNDDRSAAAKYAAAAAEEGSRLGAELALHLDTATDRAVYDQPAAFTTFVRGGGNVELYERLSDALARRYDQLRPATLLDVGCGDGLALGPALERTAQIPATVDVVEPSAALLDAAKARLAESGLIFELRTWHATAQDFFARLADGRRWHLAQSTFALQSLPPDERAGVLRALRETTEELVLAEFDTPEYPEGSPEHLRSLVTRYERGIAEYGADARLVAQGFMLPMLLGQAAPTGGRNNWEHPAEQWRRQLGEAGFTYLTTEEIADYWWAPAVLIRAR
ncbi:class I SAM-dependent methyltransferase [Amycolatopsis anabasis]|uniref:class I SAM-dependent methyltransferase n=1 Tax=Amycolatopsis anabasis TaxID=1840409 RepID=UPI00131B6D92|nr:class I SAM-dependent methyltransferase [Amycolatopsis anabasis]